MTHPTQPQHIPWVDGKTCGDCLWCQLAKYHVDPRDSGWVCIAPVPLAHKTERMVRVDPGDKQAVQCRCYDEMPFQP